MSPQRDPDKEKFVRNADADLDRQIDAALDGLGIDDILEAPPAPPAGGAAPPQGVRRGRVLSVDGRKGEVFVDFGGKTQGVAPLTQFDEPPQVGEELEFSVDRYDPRQGVLLLNRRGAAASRVDWETLEIGQTVEGVVTAVNKGGLELQVKKMRAFMPAGQVELAFVPDLNAFLGQKLLAEVTQFDREARNLVLSRRAILEREREQQKQKLLEELAEGQVRRGVVTRLADFGAFVDLGGVDGLVHISEMSYQRGRRPEDFVKVGDVVEVKVLKIDAETGRIGLSLRHALADPWADAATRYGVGTVVTGRVTRLETFGAFVEVDEGVEGLLPISEMSYQRIRHPSDLAKVGDTVRLVVLSVDAAARRMSFSLRQAQGALDASAATPDAAGPAAPPRKKHKTPLRGGLDR